MPYSIEDIKKMNISELKKVSSEIRKELIENITKTGGHLASNLGMVELSIALHYVFDSPKDLFFFDVAHQTYTHKMLTNRSSLFSTLRKFKGLSGFSSTAESIHDIYDGGHSSTSISYALGYLEAKTNNPSLFDQAIVVIGDASIVNGLAMEALNYLGSKKNQKLIIILNDNEMGISKNNGGLAKTFNQIRVKGKFKLLRRLTPKFVKKALSAIAYKNNIFTGFGLKYLGIIDGHNLKDLINALSYAKKCKNSVVIHVKTTKGKGFKFAEEDRTGVWHSVSPFNAETGEFINLEENCVSFGKVLCEHLLKIIPNNKEIRVITPGMAYGSGIDEIQSIYKENFIDVGIAEENAITMASGMGLAGLIPIVFVYSTFLQRAYDELLVELARKKSHVIICLDRSGIVSADGPTHQGVFDLAYLSTIPNMNIIAPRNADEAKRAVDFAIINQGSYVIRYPKLSFLTLSSSPIEESKWIILKESLNKKYIISYGPNLDLLMDLLKSSDIGLINAIWLKPYDLDLITELCNEKMKLYFYEEVCNNNSLSSQIIVDLNRLKHESLIDDYYIVQKTLPNSYLEVGSTNELKEHYGLDLKKFIKMVEED